MFTEDIKKVTKENMNFRKVLFTGNYNQLVAMNLPVNGDIGDEVHPKTDHFSLLTVKEKQFLMGKREK